MAEYGIYNKRTRQLRLRQLDYEQLECVLDNCSSVFNLVEGDAAVQKWGSDWVFRETGGVACPWTPVEG